MSEAAFIPAEHLTKFERWQIGSIAEPAQPAGTEVAPASERAAEAERAAAREQGYQEGRAAGAAAARVEAERLRQVTAAATKELAALEEQLAGDVLDLALAIAREVVRADLHARREALVGVVREAVAQLTRGAGPAQLVLHPDDVALVSGQLGPELEALGIRVGEDPHVAPGGCRIVSPVSAIDATVPTRWQRVVATLGSRDDWLD